MSYLYICWLMTKNILLFLFQCSCTITCLHHIMTQMFSSSWLMCQCILCFRCISCIHSGQVLMWCFCIMCFRLIGGSDYKLIYRHYATLYFVFCVDSSESELGILDLIQVQAQKTTEQCCHLCNFSVLIGIFLCYNRWLCISRYSWKRWTNALRMSVSLT